MSFEELDNKIKEAADLHHPAYDADAWGKMEKLLDEHMPVEEKRKRRFIFWWLLPLVAGGVIFFLKGVFTTSKPIANSGSNISATISSQKKGDDQLQTKKNTAFVSLASKNSITETKKEDINTSQSVTIFTAKKSITTEKKYITSNHTDKHQSSGIAIKKGVHTLTTKTLAIVDKKEKSDVTPDIEVSISKPFVTNNLSQNIPDTSSSTSIAASLSDEPTTGKANKKIPVDSTTTDSVGRKDAIASTKKKNQFFATLSVAPDVSFVSGNSLGAPKIITGGGIGYSIKDKVVLRAGFYVGNKTYTASGSSYTGDAAFYQYYPYLENVNANCRIYEIPLSVSFNLAKRKGYNFFASTGISTLLMKEETYNYYYKYTPAGSTYEKSWTYKNENKHFFSVLTLSGGYQHMLGKKTFFIIEPYLKLPLSGVGAGKVKLNSTGILFTAGIKLF